jgi:hypothetical protein
VNLDDLKALVRKGESERAEFKRSTGQRTAAAKTVCAMLNGLGGFVVFGVDDKGEIAGQQVATKTLEELSNELRRIKEIKRSFLCRFPVAAVHIPSTAVPICETARPPSGCPAKNTIGGSWSGCTPPIAGKINRFLMR